jgi:predicted nucleic acid-binding protein
METIVVDSSVWVDYFGNVSNRETQWLERAIGTELIAMTDLILCEVLQGIHQDRQYQEIKLQLQEFEIFPSGGLETALAAASNHRLLRSKGVTVRKTIDCWIATFCIRNKYRLLHRDRDFDPFESELGLRVVRPG